MGLPLPAGAAVLAGSPWWDRKEDKRHVSCIWSQYEPVLMLSLPLLGEAWRRTTKMGL